MKTEELMIEGMNCGHCVKSVEQELSKLDGVRLKSVVIGKALVEYDESRAKWQDLDRAIGNAGFRLVIR